MNSVPQIYQITLSYKIATPHQESRSVDNNDTDIITIMAILLLQETGILYRGYRDEWHDHTKYQFDKYECNADDVFAFEPGARNVELKYIPTDAVPVDIATALHGWIICHYYTLRPHPVITETAPPTDLTHFITSQPAYISQYYANIK